MSDVPFLDVGAGYRELRLEIDAALARVLEGGSYILGEEVTAFEREFAEFVGAAGCVGVGNGLDALTLALRALGVGPGDEVIVPASTYIATWLAVSQCGATPVPVEVVETTGNIDPNEIEAAITERTKAMLPVHLYGQPADLDPILRIAARHRLKVVEDAAQAHGARYRGRRIGTHGDAVAWSFYPSKNLGAVGDGGAVTSDDRDLLARVRTLGNYGSPAKYLHEVKGVNSRLDPLQAAVLRVKLGVLDEWNERRRHIAERYGRDLADAGLELPFVPVWAEPVWHVYVVRTERRDELRMSLATAGIECLVHYPIPPHLQRAYAELATSRVRLPISTRLARRCLSLPIGPHLQATEVTRVVDRLVSHARRKDWLISPTAPRPPAAPASGRSPRQSPGRPARTTSR